MKKNFLKKLSFVMALAMLLSMTTNAAGVLAATAPHLNSTTKYLHLSGDYSEFDFNVAHKLSGWKYEWTSSNEDVAVVDEANGVTTAAGVGTATITVAITDKKGNDVKELSAKVIVRDNIKTVTISNPLEAGKTLAINEEKDFNRTFVTVSGSTTKTSSITRWTVDKTETATISDSGLFKATAAGDYKVTALAFQSKAKYDAWKVSKDATLVLASNEVTVTVAASMKGAKQLSFTKAELTFDTDMSKELTKDNLKAYRVIAGVSQPVDLLVKEVKFDTTGKVATVEMYVDFMGGETYKFVYGKLEGTFVAAKAEADKVDSVVIQNKEAVYTNGATTLTVKLFDVNGVDITTTALTGQVSYELTNNVGYLNGDKLTLFAKGDVAAVKATFHTYKYDSSYNEIVKTGTGNVVAVDAASYTIGNTVQRTLSKATPDWSKAAVTTIAAGDTGYSVWARIRSTDTSKEEYYYSYPGTTIYNGKITFSSSNSDVLIVDTYGTVYPAKAGSAVIIIYYDNKAVDTFPVVVTDSRAAAVFTLDKQAVTLSNSPSVAATAEVKLSIKDQLGADFSADPTKISFEALASNPTGGTEPLTWADGTKMKLNVTASGVKEGTYTYKVKAYDKVQILVVTIQKPTLKTDDSNYLDDVIYYQLTLDNTSVDTIVNNDNALKTVKPTLLGYASNGVAVYKADWSATDFTYTVTKDNNVATLTGATLTDGTIEVTLANGVKSAPTQSASGPAITVVSGAAMGALGNGTYIVTAKDSTGAVKGTASFTVTNTQPKAAYVLEKNETTATTVLAAVRDCFKITLSGSDIADNDLYSVDYVYNGTTVSDSTNDDVATDGNYFIKSVKFIKTYTKDGVTYAVEYTVDINRTIVAK